MSNPVPKQKKSRQNSTRHTQEGIDVCVPKPPQTPPIQWSFLDLDSLCNKFLSDIFPLSLPLQSDCRITGGAIIAQPPGSWKSGFVLFTHNSSQGQPILLHFEKNSA
jgi:hypothetical protein